jgi:hypothetical protein
MLSLLYSNTIVVIVIVVVVIIIIILIIPSMLDLTRGSSLQILLLKFCMNLLITTCVLHVRAYYPPSSHHRVSSGYCQRALVDEPGIIRTQMGKHNRSVMVAVYGTPCATLPLKQNRNSKCFQPVPLFRLLFLLFNLIISFLLPPYLHTVLYPLPSTPFSFSFYINLFSLLFGKPDSSGSVVSDYGLDDRAI